MQHVFNIAIDFEDELVRKVIEEKAVDKIMDDIRKDVEAAIYEHYYAPEAYRNVEEMIRKRNGRLQFWVKEQVTEILKESREEVIDRTAKELAAILARRKFAIDIAEEAKRNEAQSQT